MRGAIVAEKEGFLKNYTERVFKAAWVDSLNLNDNKILEKFIKNLDINPSIFLNKYINSSICFSLLFTFFEDTFSLSIKI